MNLKQASRECTAQWWSKPALMSMDMGDTPAVVVGSCVARTPSVRYLCLVHVFRSSRHPFTHCTGERGELGLKRPGEAAGGAQWAGLLVAVALCACTTPERRFGAVPDAGVRSGERNETLQTEDAGGSPSGQEEASSTETSGVESPSTSDTSSNWDAGDASGSTEARMGSLRQ